MDRGSIRGPVRRDCEERERGRVKYLLEEGESGGMTSPPNSRDFRAEYTGDWNSKRERALDVD
jgi:hypothetical protein